MADANILIADDSELNRMILRSYLGSVADSIVEACEGLEAWGRIESLRPDLAILDVNMPGLSGIEVAEKMKEDPSLAEIPVVFVTAAASSEEDKFFDLERLGASIIEKPFSQDRLLSVVGELMGS